MKVLKKKRDVFRGIAAVLVLGSLLLGGCSNLLHEKPSGDEGGYVVVTLSPGVRTLLPNAEELFYTLTFTRTSPPATVTETLGGDVSKTVGLETGSWNLVVRGYRNPADAYVVPSVSPDVQGSATGIPVSGSGSTPVEVELSAVQTGSGTLRYSLRYPASPPVTEITLNLEKRGGGYSETISLTPSTSGNTSGRLSLPSGYYDLSFLLYNGKTASPADLVHIYDNLETPASFTLEAGNFAECPDLSALENKIQDARTARDETVASADGKGVDFSWFWTSQANIDALDDAIAAAEALIAIHGAGWQQTEINNAAVTDLNDALDTFTSAKTVGTYDPAGDTDLGLFINSTREAAAGSTLGSALAWLSSNNGSINTNGDFLTVVLGADEELDPWILGGNDIGANYALTGKDSVTLTLKGKGLERNIRLNAGGSLFRVHSGVNLVLDEHISLRGRSVVNTAALVYVYGGAFTMNEGSKITGNSSSNDGGGVYVSSSATFTMNGGEISGNSASNYGGGGVVVSSNGTFTMNSGEISGNSSSNYGGGVVVSSNGTFTMNSGEISGNSSSYSGGGVYVDNSGTFTMNDGEISGNSSSYYGGGVYVGNGTFTMSNGEISGNRASYGGGVYVNSYGTFTMSNGEISGNSVSYSYGGGVYVYYYNTSFTMSGGARVNPNNPVYLGYSSDASSYAVLSIGGAFTGTGPVALVDPGANTDFIGKTAIKWAEGFSGTLPVDRIAFSPGWTADANGVLDVNSTLLGPSGATAYLSQGAAHFYRFSPDPNQSYTVTRTATTWDSNIYTTAAWADGSGILMVNDNGYGYSTTSSAFMATKTVDIIIMVYNGEGNYTLNYNQQ
jgi:hypothetical protein